MAHSDAGVENSKGNFQQRVDDIFKEVDCLNGLLDEFEKRLKPYSKSQLGKELAEEDSTNIKHPTVFDSDLHGLKKEVIRAQDKVGSLMEKFNG